MSITQEIKEILTSKDMIEITSRDNGIINFNLRLLDEIINNSDVSKQNQLNYFNIIISNIDEYIETRLIRLKTSENYNNIKKEIENILNMAQKYIYIFNEKNNLPISYSKKIFHVFKNINFSEIRNNEIDKIDSFSRYFLVFDKNNNNPRLFKYHNLELLLISNMKYIYIEDLFKLFLLKNNIQYTDFISLKFIKIPYNNFNIPFNESAYDTISFFEKNDLNDKFNFICIRSHSNKNEILENSTILSNLQKIIPNTLDIITLLNRHIFFHVNELMKLINSDKEIIHDKKVHKHLNMNKQNTLFESPFIPYENIIEIIRKECYCTDTSLIFMTIYRINENSNIIKYLIDAAKIGIKVFIYIESLARGNEKSNINLINNLKKYGIFISTSFYGLKVHSKFFLSLHNNNSGLCHISTGNYDSNRAKTFTDFQFITRDPSYIEPIFILFKSIFFKENILSSYDYFKQKTSKVLISPITLREELLERCDNTKNNIYIKCNNLCDKMIIDSLYSASERGVKVNILCRTACSMIPINENITIRSNIGKYLEHGRLLKFDNNIFIGSSDILLRNLNKRIELLVKIDYDTKIITKNGSETIDDYIKRTFDLAKWEMDKNGFYKKLH